MLTGLSRRRTELDAREAAIKLQADILAATEKRVDAKIAQLKNVDAWHMKLLANLLAELKTLREDGQPLLDRTMILYGTNLGDANKHVTTNLPTLFAGGGFKHGQHLAFDRERNYPLPNLYVNILQRLGIEADRFATSTGTMRGLEMA